MIGCLKLRKNAKNVKSHGLMEYANRVDNDEEVDKEESSYSESSDDDMDEV